MKTQSTKITPSATATTLSSLILASSATSVTSVTAAIQAGNFASISGNGSALWDIDNDGTYDFRLVASSSSTVLALNAGIIFQGDSYPGSFAATAGDDMAHITDAAIVNSLYNFNSKNAAANTLVVAGITNATTTNLGIFTSGAAPKTMGFRFTRNGGLDTHYGVADFQYEVNVALSVPTSSINITNVFWNDVADQGITGAATAVPEPATSALGLGMLALGAAGLRRWRQTKSQS